MVPAPRVAHASVHCQGRSSFRPLGSPGGTGGSTQQRGNNSTIKKRLRVAVTPVLLSGQEAKLSGPLEQPGYCDPPLVCYMPNGPPRRLQPADYGNCLNRPL